MLKLTKIATNDHRKMNYSSLERSPRAESNGGKIMFLRVLDGEILSKPQQFRKIHFSLLRCFTFYSIYTDGVIRKG